MKRITLIVLVAALCLAWGCKKDSTTSSKPSLLGLSLSQSVAPYQAVGSPLSIQVLFDKLYTSDKSKPSAAISLQYQVNGEKAVVLTENYKESNPPLVYTPDKAGSYTIKFSAISADNNYYNATISASFTALDTDESLKGLVGTTRVIDGKNILVMTTESLSWFAQNLYGTASGQVYNLSPVTEKLFGKYYSWEEASAACPSGWRLPTAAEFDALGTSAPDLMVQVSFLDKEMWTYWPGMTPTNAKGFNAIPAGYLDRSKIDTDSVSGYGHYAAYWTSDTEGDLACYRYIQEDNPLVQKGLGSKTSLALSVRCVR